MQKGFLEEITLKGVIQDLYHFPCGTMLFLI